jgi:outer membrane protein
MKKIVYICLGLLPFCFAQAVDLKTVLKDAQNQDPTYQQARANYKAEAATLDQSFAALLPNLALTGSWLTGPTTTKTDIGFNGNGSTIDATNNNTTLAYTLTLTQPLINFTAFQTYGQTKLAVKAAAANYAAAEQNLIMRVAQAYFNILQEQEILRYTNAQKTALYRQLQVAQQRYKVGLDPITSVYDAKAQYDSTRAAYIAAQNDVDTAKENLREITGQLYPKLSALRQDIPLVSPAPNDIDSWTKKAEQQNLAFIAQRFNTQAVHQGVKIAFSGHFPTVLLTGTYSNAGYTDNDTKTNNNVASTAYGLSVTLPIFSGGGVNAATNAAQYNYEAQLALLEFDHRQLVANTRQIYLSIVAEISQIEADKEAVKSAYAALESNEAGYKVGTQTIVDVLNAQTTLYQAENNYTEDRFAYVNNLLALKQAVGTLNEQDIDEINTWLTESPSTFPTGMTPAKKTAAAPVSKASKPAAVKSKTK